MSSSDDHEPFGSQLVDERFAHALLEHALGDAVERDAKRTRRALDQLWSTLVQRPVNQRFTWKRVLSAAAFLLVATALFLFNPATPNAQATLEEALRVAQEGVDRIYSLRAEHRDQTTPSVRARLFLHGPERFAIHVERGRRSGLWLGFDGAEAWIVPAKEPLPVLVNTEPDRLQDWFSERDASIPFLSLSATLEKLRFYDLKTELNDDKVLLRGRKRAEGAGPTSIVVTIAEDSGIVQHLEAYWDAEIAGEEWEGLAPFFHASLNLEPHEQLDSGFFSHAMHHQTDRLIRRF